MSRRTFALALAVVAVVLAVHAQGLVASLRGNALFGHPLGTCDSHLLGPEHLGARRPDIVDACDLPYSHRIALDALDRIGDRWDTLSLPAFLLRAPWEVAVESRAMNVLDFVLFLWPAHALFDSPGAIAVVHVGLVALAAVGAFAFARVLNVSTVGALGAALVCGTAGPVLECLARGQYPQAASAVPFLLYFLGLAWIVGGRRPGVRPSVVRRAGVVPAAVGMALAALFYWQNALVLGLGTLVFIVAAGPRTAWAGRRPLLAAAALTVVLCLPALVPLLTVLAEGADDKLRLLPWGTSYASQLATGAVPGDLLDEVPWFVALDPSRGWALPLMPLLPAAFLGFRRRGSRPWLALALFGAVMALGPLPVVPTWLGGIVLPEFGPLPRRENHLYTLIYQWVPSASRMRHPLRYALLASVGLTWAVAHGLPRLESWRRGAGVVSVGAALAWAVAFGPWPAAHHPFPRPVLEALDDCRVLVLLGTPAQEAHRDQVLRLAGLTWHPVWPVDIQIGIRGAARPDARQTALSGAISGALAMRLQGGAAALPEGACVVFNPAWNVDPDTAWSRLNQAFGPPVATVDIDGLLSAFTTQAPVRIGVFRERGGAR
jgi:hypothetical protein